MSTKKVLVSVAALMLAAFFAIEVVPHRGSSPVDSTVVPSTSVVRSGPLRTPTPLAIAQAIYESKLGAGWEDWGWGPHDLNTGGPAKIVFGGYGGIIFRHDSLDPNFGAISFRYNAPQAWGDFLNVSLKSATARADRLPTVRLEQRHLATLQGGWREALIDFSELNPDGLAFDRVVISARTVVPSDSVLLDEVVLVKPSEASSSGSKRDARLSIQCREATHAINPMIYGSAQGDWESGQTAQRMGGNPTSRFNWDLGFWNSGNDWFYENGKSVDLQQFLEAGIKHGAHTALTVPMIGWVAKDAVSVGFPRGQFPNQRKFDPNRAEAGDGHRADGSSIRPGPATQTSVAAPPELIGRWVHALRDRDLKRNTRSVQMYILDNEPSLWDTTHHDVHPEPVSYDELLDRTLRYATEIRKNDPDGVIAGPAEWGWKGYMDSGKDRAARSQGASDRHAHADMPLIAWYLQQIGLHESAEDVRLLDVLDVHFYPAARGVYGDNARTDPEGAALRLRSTRSLWDASYTDESWIGEPIKLIPRLKDWVATYHPGLAVSIGEWSFGADQHISGGLATAEALGRFGQYELDSAFYWDGPKAGTATFWAFRAYRNFDGKGGRFQDVSLPTHDSADVSLFASRDASSTQIVAVLLNRDPSSTANVHLYLEGCARVVSQRAFRYLAGSTGLSLQPPGTADDEQISISLAPYSITVLDIGTDPKP